MTPATFTQRGVPVSDPRGGVPAMRGEVYETLCRHQVQDVSSSRYTRVIPKLWNDTVEAHRREVRDATLDTTAALVAKHGLRSVTMSQIAEKTGIGRATLYKYFSGVEAILLAWHERQVTRHLAYLTEVRDRAGNAGERLKAVLEAYALISHEHHGTELAALLHRGEHVARAQRQLSDMVRDLLADAAETGDVRDDIPPDELARYCLHALSAAGSLPSKAAVHRLVTVSLAGLRPTGPLDVG
jgi:AcrR family transcriptional regulator